jgi:hypothetical protein
MKVYILTYLSRNWNWEGRMQCICKQIWEVELYPTREAAEAAGEGKMFHKILEKEVPE